MRKAALLVLFLVTLSPCQGAPPVEADPKRDYRITPDVGPWVICAASYSGPNAPVLARQLVLQVRQRDKMPAWYFNRGEQERREQQEALNRMREHAPPDARVRMVRIPDQYAVLIGGYPDIDAANRALKDVKKLKAPELKLGPDITTTDRTIDPQTGKILAINPLASAFVARNPAIPQNQQAKGDDPFLKSLNSGEEFSLLNCKKPYTLAVKEYHGISTTQPRSGGSAFLEKLGLGGKASDALGASAMQAHEFASLLRTALKLEAYVLHTRKSSIVAVGGFDSPEDPEMQRVQRQLASLSFKPGAAPLAPTAGGKPAPKPPDASLLQLFSPAIPMRVPRP